jgi:REP element-mobilizing transposase RayT
MSNHIHILATGGEDEDKLAKAKELEYRYRLMYGRNKEMPIGSHQSDGDIIYDEDLGVERLRRRLGSISRFMQEVKQTFSRWYNKKHNRKGYLWGDRFKGVLVSNGNAMLACSAYIDLNPVRAGIVKNPEDYKYSSMGMRVRSERRLKRFATYFEIENVSKSQIKSFYRQFVFETGGVKQDGKAKIPNYIVEKVQETKGKLRLGTKLHYKCANFSDGIAIGTKDFIETLQSGWQRKIIKARFMGKLHKKETPDENGLFVTRLLE